MNARAIRRFSLQVLRPTGSPPRAKLAPRPNRGETLAKGKRVLWTIYVESKSRGSEDSYGDLNIVSPTISSDKQTTFKQTQKHIGRGVNFKFRFY